MKNQGVTLASTGRLVTASFLKNCRRGPLEVTERIVEQIFSASPQQDE